MRRITLTLALSLAACSGGGGSDTECSGHGELHDDHCHCDEGYSPARGDETACVLDVMSPDADAGVDMSAPAPEPDDAGVDGGDPEPDDMMVDTDGPAPEPEPEFALDGAEVTARTLLDHEGDRVWLLDARAEGHRLRIENYAAFGGPVAPGRVAIGASEADYAACGLCLVLETGCASGEGACDETWMPVPGSGEVELTALGAAEGEAFSGQLEGLRFRAVQIDPETYATTVVEGGGEAALADWAFEVSLDVECNGHGHLHGDTCHCDAGYQNDPDDPGRCVPA